MGNAERRAASLLVAALRTRSGGVIGTIRRECLDHVIVFSEASLRRTLLWYFTYYHGARTHLSLRKDAPETRPVHPTTLGRVIAIPQVGGLHHRERRAA